MLSKTGLLFWRVLSVSLTLVTLISLINSWVRHGDVILLDLEINERGWFFINLIMFAVVVSLAITFYAVPIGRLVHSLLHRKEIAHQKVSKELQDLAPQANGLIPRLKVVNEDLMAIPDYGSNAELDSHMEILSEKFKSLNIPCPPMSYGETREYNVSWRALVRHWYIYLNRLKPYLDKGDVEGTKDTSSDFDFLRTLIVR